MEGDAAGPPPKSRQSGRGALANGPAFRPAKGAFLSFLDSRATWGRQELGGELVGLRYLHSTFRPPLAIGWTGLDQAVAWGEKEMQGNLCRQA